MSYKNIHGLKFGTDPEIFATYWNKDALEKDTKFNAELPFSVIPAYVGDENVGLLGAVGGNIKHPVYVDGNGFKIIGDGAAYEINLKGPCDSPQEMWDKVQEARHTLSTLLKASGYDLLVKPLVNFDYTRWWVDEYLNDERYFMSMNFGCDPDKDACNTDWLCKIEDVSRHPFRYGGGHLHFSGDPIIEKFPIPFVKLLAIYLGNYGIATTPDNQLEKARAKYYGKPGKWRPQTYPDGTFGVEYRALSNSWMNYTYGSFEFMFELVNTCVDLLKNRVEGRKMIADYLNPTITAVTNADKNMATSILKSLNVI